MKITDRIKPKCIQCGKCCWDWKTPNPQDKCEHLAEDMKTCLIPNRKIKLRPECVDFPQPHMVCDLPDECPFKIYFQLKQLEL